MQRLPRAAFVSSVECSVVIFVSHRWETPEDPDPTTTQAQLVSIFLAGRHESVPLEAIGVWYDFSSLPQTPRTLLEQTAFDAMLCELTQLQLACSTVVCGLAAGLTDYTTRAWCVLESYVAGNKHEAAFYSQDPGNYGAGIFQFVPPSIEAAVQESLDAILLDSTDFQENQLWRALWDCPACGCRELAVTADAGRDATESLGALVAAHHCTDDTGNPPLAHVRAAMDELGEVVERFNSLQQDSPLAQVLAEFQANPPTTHWEGLQLLLRHTDPALLDAVSPRPALAPTSDGEASDASSEDDWDDISSEDPSVESRSGTDSDSEGDADLEATDSSDLTAAAQLRRDCRATHRVLEEFVASASQSSAGRSEKCPDLSGLAAAVHIACTDNDDVQMVVRALYAQYLDKLRAIASARPDNILCPGGTPLHLAAATGSSGLVRHFLAESDVQAAAADEFGRTALHVACAWGSAPAATLIVQAHPSLVHVKDSTGATPFMAAAGCAQGPEAVDKMKALLDAVGDDGVTEVLLATDDGERTAVEAAAVAQDKEAVQFLVGLMISNGIVPSE